MIFLEPEIIVKYHGGNQMTKLQDHVLLFGSLNKIQDVMLQYLKHEKYQRKMPMIILTVSRKLILVKRDIDS